MQDFLFRIQRWIGSLKMAVILLVAIAGVLAWGTVYEERYGTEAVKQAVYGAWWFQALLAFLALNLAAAAIDRFPWKKRHIPFLLAHAGIILILVGGIVSSSLGIEGQLIVSEGQTERYLRLPQQAFVIRDPLTGEAELLPTAFESRAWEQEPQFVQSVNLGDRRIELAVNKYYPDAATEEVLETDVDNGGPAVQLVLRQGAQEESRWLLARDPNRFALQWGESEALFVEPLSEQAWRELLDPVSAALNPRGTLEVKLPDQDEVFEIPVPQDLSTEIAIGATGYRIRFKDYFADFAINETGVTDRSPEPINPAVSFLLMDDDTSDPYLLFALHPDFAAMHERRFRIPAEVRFRHPAGSQLPANSVILGWVEGRLLGAHTDAQAIAYQLGPIQVDQPFTHPQAGYRWSIAQMEPSAAMTEKVRNRSNRVKRQALRVSLSEGDDSVRRWMTLDDSADFVLNGRPVALDYGAALYPLPVSVKLLDFRKVDYPGTEMAADFESDLVLNDPEADGPIFEKVSMNQPINYAGFKFFQASYIDGPVQTTILAVRKDPGTPLVYAGYLIVIFGIVTLFWFKPKRASA